MAHGEAKEQQGTDGRWGGASHSTGGQGHITLLVFVLRCHTFALRSAFKRYRHATRRGPVQHRCKEESTGKYHLPTLASAGWFTSIVAFFSFPNASHQRNVQSNSTKEGVQRHPLCQNWPSDNIKIIICFCCLALFIPTKKANSFVLFCLFCFC